MKIQAVFFDLDGTLFDTAPDLTFALNQLLMKRGLETVSEEKFRPHIQGGGPTMLGFGFGISPSHPDYPILRTEFLQIYSENLAQGTKLFPGMEHVLNYLDNYPLPWGIVTNKPGGLTTALLTSFGFMDRCVCIVAGDTLPTKKPHPGTLLHACQIAQVSPQHSVYIGDTPEDVMAARAAGMYSIATTWGYREEHNNPNDWQADVVIHHAQEIVTWLQSHMS